MSDTHDYNTKKVLGKNLTNEHVLVGESGGLSAIYELEPSSAMPGFMRVETEHGPLYLDPDEFYDVLDEQPGGPLSTTPKYEQRCLASLIAEFTKDLNMDEDSLYIVVVNGSQINVAGWERTFQIPTFYVNAYSEDEARQKAKDICNPTKDEGLYLYINVQKVSLT